MKILNLIYSNCRLSIILFTSTLFLLFENPKLSAQNQSFYFNSFSAENGLSQNSINSITQDKKGFIWIGTQSGLNRFDGYKFKNWFQEPGKLNSLTSGFINHLATDRQDNIWIGTTTGLNCFDSKLNKFYSFSYLIKNKEISHELINYIFVDSENYLWIGTKNGLNQSISPIDKLKPGFFDLKFNSFFHQKSPVSLSNSEITCISEDNRSNIWIGTKNGLNKYNKASGKFEQFYFEHYHPGQNGANEINDIEQLNDSIFWIATEAGLFELNIKSKAYSNFENSAFFIENKISGSIRTILTDSKGNRWLGAFGNGLLLYTSENKEFHQIKKNENSKNNVSDNFIICLFEDKSGTLFIGNFTNGINTTKIDQNHFELYRHNDGDESGLSENITRHIYCQDENTVWMGTLSTGLEKFNPKTRKFEHFPLKTLKKNNAPVALQFVLPKNKNELWISTNRAGLLLYNYKTNKYKQYLHSDAENSISGNDIYWLYADADSVLWIGTYGSGLDKLDLKTGKFKNYKVNSEDASTSSDGIITYIIPDKNKVLWIGSWGGGIIKFNPKTEKHIHYKNSIANSNSISSDFVLAIHIDKNGILWFGTSSGLNKYNPFTDKFTHYGKKNGFKDEFINSIEEDKHDNLWLSTNRGIVKFNKQTASVKCFDVIDGLQDNEFSSGINTSLPDGRMIFGGIKGFNVFHPDSIRPGIFSPNIVISEFQLFYKNIETGQKYSDDYQISKSIGDMDTIILNYKDNVIGFEFTALDFKNPDNIQYAFRLIGFEENWNTANNNERFARYTNLAYGDYVLQIKATNSDGIWNEKMKELHISITAPFWLTNGFKIAVVFLLILFVLMAIRIRINILTNQKNKLEKIVEERTIEIQNKSLELKEKYEEIVVQDEEIREQAEELRSLSEKLKESNLNLSQKVKERTIELEAALYKSEDSQKLISSFLSNLSHEIRTPLNAILGFNQILGMGEVSETMKNKYIKIIEQNVESLLTQINNIMDVAKLNSGQYKLYKSSFSFNHLFLEVFSEVQPLSKTYSKEISIKLLNTEDGLNIYTDRDAVKSILLNLVENAIKYTETGSVEFGFKIKPENIDKSKDYLIVMNSGIALDIFVNDTGIGISENDQLRIFDPFRKIEDNKNKLYRGTGIGLTLVKSLVENLNGHIKLESKLGMGTKFLVSFSILEI